MNLAGLKTIFYHYFLFFVRDEKESIETKTRKDFRAPLCVCLCWRKTLFTTTLSRQVRQLNRQMNESADDVIVTERVRNVVIWPTDTVDIDHNCSTAHSASDNNTFSDYPHTIIIFFPGNPGLAGWYVPSLQYLVQQCGKGFAARAISYAGHGTSDDIADVEKWQSRKKERDTDIPFTVDGQIVHKSAYMDMLDADMKERAKSMGLSNPKPPRYIFMAHSIGCHMIQRLLVLRPDILRRTDLVLYITPFNRMKSDRWSEFLLFRASSMPDFAINHAQGLMRLLSSFPVHVLDTLIKGDIKCDKGRKITVDLLQQPHFGRNFFELGTEEVRDLPEIIDACAFRVIGKHCPTCILYVGNDKWAREFHISDIKELQARGVIPKNIHTTHLPQLVHDYIVRPEMVTHVDEFCLDAIQEHVLQARKQPQSRL